MSGSRHTDLTDVRAWLRSERPDLEVQPRGAIKKEHQAIYHEAHPDADDSRETPAPEDPDGLDHEQEPASSGEVPPEDSGRPRWMRRGAPRTTTGRPRAHRRVPVDGLFAMAWGALGKLTERPETLPVSRCMKLQAPAAGLVLDDALKGSFIDRMAQPLARGAKRGEIVFGVVGPPILVAAVCQRPELYDVVKPMLMEALKSWVLLAGPKIRKAKEKERRLLEELDGDLSSIEEMIDALFAPPDAVVITDAEPARNAA